MLSVLTHIGDYFIMLSKVFSLPSKRKLFFKQLIIEFEKVGLNSLGIVVVISHYGIMTA